MSKMNNPVDEVTSDSGSESLRPIPSQSKASASLSDDFYQNKFSAETLINWLNSDND